MKVYKISHDAPMVTEEMGYTGDCESFSIVVAETADDARKHWESSEIPADIISVEQWMREYKSRTTAIYNQPSAGQI